MTDYLKDALDLARKGVGAASPNPMVGAVVVHDGEVVGRGYHTYQGMRHAEVVALDEAGERARGATLYVNLEPCCHQGRTGPCTARIIEAGVARVTAAMKDPNPQVAGNGFETLRKAGVAVEISDVHQGEARKLNEAYVHFTRYHRPLVTVKAAVTLDGKIAAPEENYGWITSEKARAHVQHIRHAHDVILTGIGTVLADDCRLTDRTGRERSRPLMRVVVDSQLRIPVTAKMVTRCDNDLMIVTTSAASKERCEQLEARGVRVKVLDGPAGRTDLPGLVEWLGSENYLSLMVEAGSKLNWSMLAVGAADKVLFYYAPKILGGLKSLPVVGGKGRMRREDAILFRDLSVMSIPPDEFVVEAHLAKEA